MRDWLQYKRVISTSWNYIVMKLIRICHSFCKDLWWFVSVIYNIYKKETKLFKKQNWFWFKEETDSIDQVVILPDFRLSLRYFEWFLFIKMQRVLLVWVGNSFPSLPRTHSKEYDYYKKKQRKLHLVSIVGGMTLFSREENFMIYKLKHKQQKYNKYTEREDILNMNWLTN